MKKILLSAAAFAVVLVSAVAVAPTTSEAVPAFARQTGAACLACHFQAIPRLTTMGRNFSMSGMRDMGDQALLEDDVLSLPAVFNAGFLMKVLVRNVDGLVNANESTGIMAPDESAIFIGGRYGENFGALTEVSTNNGGGVAQAKLNYVIDTDFGHVNVAMISGDVGLGVLFSDPSNAVRHTNRAAIQRAEALQRTDMMNSAVTGFGVSAFANDSIYVGAAVYGAYSPGEITGEWGGLSGFSTYLRAAYIADIAGLEAVIGGFYISSTASSTSPDNIGVTDPAATQIGVDLQLQGDLGDVSVGFYFPYVITGEQPGALAGTAAGTDITGGQLMATVAFGHTGVKLGYDFSTSTAAGVATDTTAPYFGAWYSAAQNVEFELAYHSQSVGTAAAVNTTTLVIEYVY